MVRGAIVSVFQNEVAVHEILELFGGLQSGSGLTLSHKPLGPADELSDSGDRTSRAGSGAATLSDTSVGMGAILHGEDKATVVGKGGVTQKAIEKFGKRYLPREEVGTDEAGQDGEGEDPSAALE